MGLSTTSEGGVPNTIDGVRLSEYSIEQLDYDRLGLL